MLGEKYPWGRRPRMDPDGPATAPTAPNGPNGPNGPQRPPTAPNGLVGPRRGNLIFTIFIQKFVISIEKYLFCID